MRSGFQPVPAALDMEWPVLKARHPARSLSRSPLAGDGLTVSVEEGQQNLIGNLKLAELKVPDVDCVLGTLAEHLSTRSVRLARMILIQAIRNAMVNDLALRNIADLAAVPTGKPGRPSKSLNLDQALAVLHETGL
jgi:hypothetical protein